ncbi:MAG: magnesium chelatase subunit H [Rubrivivax sp.]
MPRRISAPEAGQPIHIALVTLDSHVAGAAARAERRVLRELPGLRLSVHAASEWGEDACALERCRQDIATADLVIATMLFMEEHFLPVLPALQARREQCDAMVCAMSAGEVMRLTRMGRFAMDGRTGGPLALLKRLRGKPKTDGGPASGAAQMKMLRRVPQILRFIPGTAQDVRAYFLCLQYWLAGSEDNIANLLRLLVERYADGPRRALRSRVKASAPIAYPEVGVYHPALPGRMAEQLSALPPDDGQAGTVGLLLMRSYLLAGNSAHYDGVIAALQARGLKVIPAFASGLDARPAVERFFLDAQGRPCVDAVVSLTGFSLVGGPAYNDARAAEELLARLDVPYIAALPVEFQSLAQWQESSRGLLPVEATMMVAIPELDGATGSVVFGGRAQGSGPGAAHDMVVAAERAAMLAARVQRWVALRRRARAERRVGVVLFNFPPNAGAAGTAAFLSVFESLHNLLAALQRQGYTVDLPPTVDALRDRIVRGNAERYGAGANVHARISTDTHVRRETWLQAIESQWGAAPGRQQSDGASIHVLGERFGNVFVGLQPSMGYEGDPMRLLFEQGFAPTHAFAAFYRWLREDFRADVLLHFGTHGSLEFMPGKQAGLSGDCWPDRLIGDLPNLYLYAANNPSEGTIAKRRAAATLVSYLSPTLGRAGLYRGLSDLRQSIERWRGLPPVDQLDRREREELATLIQQQAAAVDLAQAEPAWGADAVAQVHALTLRLTELEQSLIPHGLHVVGATPGPAERIDWLEAIADTMPAPAPTRAQIEALVAGAEPADDALRHLAGIDQALTCNSELDGLLHALDGGFVRPAPGGDLLRTPEVLPTGRNLHGFDPFRLPSAFAVRDGAQQAARLLARHLSDGHDFPESVALVLWGTDNLKSEGAPIAQALALIGARPRFDGYGRLAGAELIPLEQMDRPRVDVMITLSGIFRDLLPLQTRLLAEAAFLAASADEPEDRNFVRKHALAFQREQGCDLETAALRVFGNAEGAYGANVNHLVDSSRWEAETELAEAYTRRKGFAYGRNGRPVKQPELLHAVLSRVDLAYQNLESVELGVTSVDTYFDTLGGITRAVQRAKGSDAATAPVYIGDQTRGDLGSGTVRTLAEQVALETHTRMLNPRFFEALLDHGYEGVRHIEAHVTNTFAWSATTGQVQPWVYQRISETFVLDDAMRERIASLNPAASAKLAQRLLEAHRRRYWQPDADTLAALERAGDELEDRLEGVYVPAAAPAASPAPVSSPATPRKAAA